MSMEAMRNIVSQMLKPLRNRVYTMITRAVIETVNDTEGMQLVKLNLFAGESRDNVEHFQNFGFSSNPPDGSECIALSVGGNREHLIAIVTEDRKTRVKNLAKGESVQFNTNGNTWHLKNNGLIEGQCNKLKIKNKDNEFVDLLVQLADQVAKGTTNTMFGPLKKNNSILIAAIKIKLETFKE